MAAGTLARHLQCLETEAQALLAAHKAAFPRYWSWSDDVENSALLHRELSSVFGWHIAIGSESNPRALRNFPLQANGAEMLRLACCLTTERGISVCAPNHDALLIEAPIAELEAAICRTRQFMAEASATVLDGFELRTDVRVIYAPDRWTDQRGEAVWSAVQQAIANNTGPDHQRARSCSPEHPRPISLYVSKKDNPDVAN